MKPASPSSRNSRTLICAASTVEAESCLQGIRRAGAEDRFEIHQTGIGPERAHEALAKRLAQGPRPDHIVSSGFAGGLHPSIHLGTWIWGQTIHETQTLEHLRITSPPDAILETPLSWLETDIVCVSRLTHPSSMLRADETRLLSVDMESHTWGSLAHSYQIPFSVIRLISDTPGAPLPLALRILTDSILEPSPHKRIRIAARGLQQFVQSPLATSRFLFQSGHLLRQLSAGWTTLSLAWPHLPNP